MDQESKFTVIFGMDGVLVDSTSHIKESFKRVAGEKGLNFDKKRHKSYSGHSLRDQLSMWGKEYSVDLGDANDFSEKALKIQLELFGPNAVVDKNLTNLLNELKTKGVRMGVGTSSGRKRAESILSLFAISDFFSALVTADDVDEHKPNPHIFLETACRLGVSPERCVVVEDAASGIEAAHRAGMRVVGLLTKDNSREQLFGADKIISSFHDLSYEELEKIFI